MERDATTMAKFEDFNINLRQFILEQSEMYEKEYTKERLVKKVDDLQDFVWENLQNKKEKCLK